MRYLISLVLIPLFAFLSPLFANAQVLKTNSIPIGTVTLVNHFTSPLYVHIYPKSIPYLTPAVVQAIDPGHQITLTVKSPQVYGENKTLFVSLAGVIANTFSYFGIVTANDTIAVHGYLNSNMAYSWNTAPNPTVTFCTSKQFVNGHCL